MQLSSTDKKLYYTFILFAIIELLSRSNIPAPSLTIVLAAALYYWVYVSYKYIHPTRITSKFNATPIIFLFLFWNFTIIIRGLIDSNDYWDYKNVLLEKGPFLFFSLSIFLASKTNLLKAIFSFLLKFYLILSFIFMKPVFWGNTGRIICNIIPLSLLLSRKYQIYLLSFVIITIPFTWEARGWILRAFFGLFLAIIFYLKKKNIIGYRILRIFFKYLYVLFVCVPLIFVYLGYTNTFNVFAMNDYINIESKEEKAELVDTRSFLYQAVNETLKEKNQTWIGLGGVSEYLQDWHQDDTADKALQEHGRSHTESGILNMYLYGGWIGAALFSLLFWTSAYYGIFKSQNIICKLTGIYIIFRWVISFVDEPETWLCSNLMMYFFMGICLNKQYRNIPDKNWFQWFQSIK